MIGFACNWISVYSSTAYYYCPVLFHFLGAWERQSSDDNNFFCWYMNHPRDYFEPTTFSSICYATFSWSPQSNSILMVRPLLSRTLAVRYFQALFLWCLKKCDITSYYYWSAPYKLFSVPILCQMLTYGRRIPIPELFARIDAVDASTVKRVANRFIFDQV